MDVITAILQLITNYGFPIVACVFVWRQNREQAAQYTELITRTTSAINATTQALSELASAIADLKALVMRGEGS